MPRKYYIDSKEVKPMEWREAFSARADADVQIITQQIPKISKPRLIESTISAEKARFYRSQTKI